MSNHFGVFEGVSIYSGYTPKENIKEYDVKILMIMELIERNGLTSITFKHNENDIEVSFINGDFHIDNVTSKHK